MSHLPVTPVLSTNSILEEEYDFIVVGAGSAGCVVANRLSEVKHWKILLLEARIEDPEVADIPALVSILSRSNIDWMYCMQPEQHSCRSRKNGGCAMPRGKARRKGTKDKKISRRRRKDRRSVTLFFYFFLHIFNLSVEGSPSYWLDLSMFPQEGQSSAKGLKGFQVTELKVGRTDGLGKIVKDNPRYHRQHGYQSVQQFPYIDINAEISLNAWQEFGYNVVDVNAKNQVGVMKVQTTSANGIRQSTNNAFICPTRRKRRNLTIKTESYVTKLLVDHTKRRIIGVEYASINNRTKLNTVFAKKEVILSAESINSPKILMLSGFGPGEELEKYNIQVIDNLSVGRNLQDHVAVTNCAVIGLTFTSTNKNISMKEEDILSYQKTHRGPLSAIGTSSISVFLQTIFQHENGVPDIQLIMKIFLNDLAEVFVETLVSLSYYDAISIYAILLSPKSRGFILLNESDPFWTSFNLPWLLYNSDLDVLVEAILKLFDTESFKKNDFKLMDKPLPACRQFEFGAKDYWKCLGHARWGQKSDPEAVVDGSLRVYGNNGLRVVDASIIPKIFRRITNAPTIMITEKASDMIKEEWLSSRI
ncbi:Glucose dehydrogenase [acceptor] [Melipona quadrifasciata]|uniref:Glucose dehydrogenase [acceptor] n=1 Tax=Melipona quadrifasciata TaxID=166423 RepID=A0A0N0U3J9_9HYME|nr:Glucose dehydrogenase [acceptor] [Melipona quadrifasciata]